MTQIKTTLETQAKILGVELFGISSLEIIDGYQGIISKRIIDRYKSAISIGYIIPESILMDSTKDYYNYFLNKTVLPTLDRTALYLARIIEKNGEQAFPIPAFNYFNDDSFPFYFHDLVASYSGLGWLGKNNRLISKKYGSRIQATTILTNLELEPNEINENLCKDCTICMENCPVNALTGIPFHPNHKVDERQLSNKCLLEFDQTGSITVCLKCINICPYNK